MPLGDAPGKDVGFCPHCGNNAQQRLVGRHSTSSRDAGDITNYSLVACETCEHPLLYRSDGGKPTPADVFRPTFSLKKKELVWPASGHLHHSVPESIRRCYEEAAGIKARAPNAFANQIRRALEALCKDRGANKRTLNDSLSELSTEKSRLS